MHLVGENGVDSPVALWELFFGWDALRDSDMALVTSVASILVSKRTMPLWSEPWTGCATSMAVCST